MTVFTHLGITKARKPQSMPHEASAILRSSETLTPSATTTRNKRNGCKRLISLDAQRVSNDCTPRFSRQRARKLVAKAENKPS